MKTYKEIDLDETPIIALACGHFFTAETLDGHMGMGAVYVMDGYGEFTGLKDVSSKLAQSIPCCPDCRSPVKQHATHRYNRVVNRAVIDEMSKRFLVDGQRELRALEQQTEELGQSLETSRAKILNILHQSRSSFTLSLRTIRSWEIEKELEVRQAQSIGLRKAIQSFCTKVAHKHQPAQKLYDATVHVIRQRPLYGLLAALDPIDDIPAVLRDRRVTFGGRIVQIKMEHIFFEDKFAILQALKSAENTTIKVPGEDAGRHARAYFGICKAFIADCKSENLPKLSVEATLCYARVARSHESYCQSNMTDVEKATEHIEFCRVLLEEAKELCKRPFQSADSLSIAVQGLIDLFRKQWYEEVTAEEIADIKAAMVNGPGGIATHSGHWYNCANGHPVSP